MKEEQEREKHPEQRAKTKSDLQDQVYTLIQENNQLKRELEQRRKPRWKKR
ncbi:MAG: hypothetical protein KBT03_06005 [Bacteroidales bacterium]|nr:hypothetical protein [Candidatus Scybalousia scybalohippi]